MDEKKFFVCDLGFSAAKCLYDGKRFRVKSAYRQTSDSFVAGDAAMRGVGSSYIRSTEDLVCKYPDFVSHCMEKAGVDEPVNVVVGLPYGFWDEQRKRPGQGIIANLTASLRSLPLIDGVTVLPQGLGGIRSYVDSHPDATGNILAIDCGFNTAIYCIFSMEEEEMIFGNTLYKRGVTQMVTEHLKPKIEHLTPGYSYTPVEICVLLEAGEIQNGLSVYDIKPEIASSTHEYMNRLLDEITFEIKAQLGPTARFETVLLFGGGAHYVGEGLRAKGSTGVKVVVLEEPEYSNSVGFLSVARDR